MSNEREPSAHRRRLIGWSALAAACAAVRPLAAHAQDAWPSRPVRLVVPYPAGGVVDLIGRVVAERMAASLGQPVLVEPRPGANANIGAEAVARAAPDGYTLMMASPFLATNPLVVANTRWKTADFAGVGLIGAPPNLFVVPASSPVRTVAELVEYAKARPGAVNVSNPGMGSSNHLGQELFFSVAKVRMTDVMYKGQPAMIPDIASGQIGFGLLTIALAVPHIRDGRLRALAISAPRRSPELPDVPTIAEAGYPDAMFLPWYGVVAPAGTPRDIVQRLSDEMQRALADPEVVARLEKMGTQLTPAPAGAFDALIAREVQRWKDVVAERGIKAEG